MWILKNEFYFYFLKITKDQNYKLDLFQEQEFQVVFLSLFLSKL